MKALRDGLLDGRAKATGLVGSLVEAHHEIVEEDGILPDGRSLGGHFG